MSNLSPQSGPMRSLVAIFRVQVLAERMNYFGFGTTRRMVASRDSNSIGLTSNSSQPVAMAFLRSLSSANADMPMIGMSRVCGLFLRVRTGSPAVNDRHFKVHQNYVRVLGYGQFAALVAVLSRENLKITNSLKARLEHVKVIVIVFDVEHFGHVTDSVHFDGRSFPSHSITASARPNARDFAEPNIKECQTASLRLDLRELDHLRPPLGHPRR